MKYWFFDGSDVIGPFSPKELSEQKSFGETSLICPENFGEDGDHWQVAGTFDEFKPLFVRRAAEQNDPSLEQEMDTLLKEASPLAFDQTPTDSPSMQIPKKPAKPGPIEDYFNRVKEKDLGNILGIPSPADNSDMDLAHALEKQLAKTSSTRREKQSADEAVDEQTALELTQAQETHHVATATEVFATTFEDKIRQQTAAKKATAVLEPDAPATMPLVELPQMPTLQQELPAAQPEQTIPPLPAEADEPAPAVPEEPVLETSQPQADTTAQSATPQNPEPGGIIPDPAVLRTEKVEVNSVSARLKQTQEMKDFLRHTQHTQKIKRQLVSHARLIVAGLAVVTVAGGLALAFAWRHKTHPAPQPAVAATTPQATKAAAHLKTQELLAEAPAAQTAPTNSGEQKALAVVYNYPLSNGRGTLGEYLSRIYQGQLSQGYLGSWEAEPLYKNTYIVKYRLTKTRKEPIIYVFQADVAKGKLTGALNNISIDLVGKI